MNKQIMTVLLGFCMLFAYADMKAQNKPGKRNKDEKEAKINELRIKYFNEKLALTESEQKAFWPIFDDYKSRDKALRDSFQRKYKKNEVVFMDDKKAEEYLNALLKLKDDENLLYREYIIKFKKVLPIKKVAMLPLLERELKKERLKDLHRKNKLIHLSLNIEIAMAFAGLFC